MDSSFCEVFGTKVVVDGALSCMVFCWNKRLKYKVGIYSKYLCKVSKLGKMSVI